MLCIFTISCSFVSENTGSLHLKLPISNESRAYRSIDSGVNKELSYSIVITPDKSNYNQFSFSEDNIKDKLFLFFNDHDYFYIGNLKNKYPISRLNDMVD